MFVIFGVFRKRKLKTKRFKYRKQPKPKNTTIMKNQLIKVTNQFKHHANVGIQNIRANQLKYSLHLVIVIIGLVILSQKSLSINIHFGDKQHATPNPTSEPKAKFASETAQILPTTKKKAFNKSKKYVEYIERFAKVAIGEKEKYNIPASITLAQGLLESGAGKSRLAIKNRNHFGIKCFSRNCHRGHCSNFEDDSHKDFFRVYKTDWESYRAHSEFLKGDRYKHLLKLDVTDYKNWAHGLKKAGYATAKDYAEKLISLIENYELYKYDI